MPGATTAAAVVAALVAQLDDGWQVNPNPESIVRRLHREKPHLPVPISPPHPPPSPPPLPTTSCPHPLVVERWERIEPPTMVRAQVTQPDQLTLLEAIFPFGTAPYERQMLCPSADTIIFHVTTCIDPRYARSLWDTPNPSWLAYRDLLERARKQRPDIYLPACDAHILGSDEYFVLDWNPQQASWSCTRHQPPLYMYPQAFDCPMLTIPFSLFDDDRFRHFVAAKPPIFGLDDDDGHI